MPARIVMVDDDEAAIIAATVALRNAGYAIVTFTDLPEHAKRLDGLGSLLPLPVDMADLMATVAWLPREEDPVPQ
jgi:CheY-like chemotaxis protein